VAALPALEQAPAEVINTLKVSRKMLEICRNWDGSPENLDLEAFTLEEAEIALQEILSHEEYWRDRPLQADNAYSMIVTATALPEALMSLPRPGVVRVRYI